jgi:micrococcal nuclease
MEYKYKVLEYRVVDGDTVDCVLDLGLDVRVFERVRLWGIDAPETRTKDLEEKEKGIAAKKFLEDKLDLAENVEFHSKVFLRGKYGRLLGDIYTDGENLNVTMLMENVVKPYIK